LNILISIKYELKPGFEWGTEFYTIVYELLFIVNFHYRDVRASKAFATDVVRRVSAPRFI
jgi:hypothetical protein